MKNNDKLVYDKNISIWIARKNEREREKEKRRKSKIKYNNNSIHKIESLIYVINDDDTLSFNYYEIW